ncbi:MAG: hypothetical protein ACH34Y_03590 [Brachymonas sp.]
MWILALWHQDGIDGQKTSHSGRSSGFFEQSSLLDGEIPAPKGACAERPFPKLSAGKIPLEKDFSAIKNIAAWAGFLGQNHENILEMNV